MVGKKIIYLILFAIVSCNGAKENAKVEKEEPKIEFSYLILKDSILIDQINQYYDSVCPNEINNKILRISYKNDNGKKIYKLRYMLNATSMYYHPVHLFFRIDNHFIGFTILNLDDFYMTKESLVQLMKEHFPDDYEYYKQMQIERKKYLDASINLPKEDDFPPPATGGYETWILTFKEGKMIDKKIER